MTMWRTRHVRHGQTHTFPLAQVWAHLHRHRGPELLQIVLLDVRLPLRQPDTGSNQRVGGDAALPDDRHLHPLRLRPPRDALV